ncbi:kinesin-like protein KIFC3 [Ylistrum balloti]|uniref:kinesin-like protein KIFC3 n=1 Tax=Ylistrum balloti TaxID=509963 RepID=UPI002905C0D3|nr:kinesin-like protein KIFC3 [Ylistrum balloti]
MFSSPSKIKRQEPVFKTPMTYSPRVLGSNGKPIPSPSRAELWRQQLGLNDDPNSTDNQSDSDSDQENLNPSANISLVEYRALQRELDERNVQRDELLFKVKTLTDKTKHYKLRLEREESTKRQHMKILCKTQETQLQEKENLITNLQGLLEENEARVQQLEQGPVKCRPLGDNNNIPHTASGTAMRLIEEVKRLQIEKVDLTRRLEEQLQLSLVPSPEGKAIEPEPGGRGELGLGLDKTINDLQKENRDLRDTIDRLHKNGQSSDTGPCTTDTEKQVAKLQGDNDRLQEELTDLKQSYGQSTDMVKQGAKQYQQLDDEVSKLRQKITTLENQLSRKSEEFTSVQNKHRQEQTTLRNESQATARKMRDLQAELTALHAKEPEVITKIKRVEVQTESEELKKNFSKCQEEKVVLESEVAALKLEIKEVRHQLQEADRQCTEKIEEMTRLEQETETVTHQLMEEIDNVKREKEEAVRSVRHDMELELETLRLKHQRVCLHLEQLKPIMVELVREYVQLQKQAKKFPTIIKDAVSQVKKETTRAIRGIHDHNQELIKKYYREMALRKKYHNELVELKGNIRVFCRVRPKIAEDGNGVMSQSVVRYDQDDDGLIHVLNKGRSQTFEVDRVFTETSTQTEVFNEVQSLVTSCIDGYNVCIFAYGQTGSGKTYTMEGPPDDAGINQRALQELFRETSNRGCDWTYKITVTVLEIYNEVIRDLLTPGDDTSTKLDVKMNTDGQLYVPGLCVKEVRSVEDVNRVFATGQKNRATATTNMNERSSRSHALLCVTVHGVNKTTNVQSTGKLNLVDLAGSERVSKSGADGTRLKEAQSINKSLSSLGDVIHALRSKQSHVPYRNSRLTYLLQDSLGGDSKTLMIVQVAPVEKNQSETVCSLNFAQRVRTVELGQASRRVENGDTEGDYANSPMVKPSTPSRSGGTPSRSAHLTPSRTGVSTPPRSGTNPLSSVTRSTPLGSASRTKISKVTSKLNL